MIFAKVIDAMVADFTTLPALAGVTVSDGPPRTNEPGAYLFVGIDNPDTDSGIGASGTQTWPLATNSTREDQGEVWLAAYADDGDGLIKPARDAATAVMKAVQDRVRVNLTLGIPGLLWLSFGDYSYRPMQTDNGAAVVLLFRVSYSARI
jgi:hypothetical protein